VPASQKLKVLRNNRHITVRDVEQASGRIAEAKDDKRFRISNGWLAQLENGMSEPSICKLFSLSAIYGVQFLDLLRLYGVDLMELGKFERIANPQVTRLLTAETLKAEAGVTNSNEGFEIERGSETQLLQKTGALVRGTPAGLAADLHRESVTYGYIGLDDFTMYPLIRPGSFVRIDTSQTKVQAGVWRNEFERPIYFVELRDAYVCGWCELQGTQLLIIPHHSSPANIRRFTISKEAEIVGRVIGFDTRCVDSAETAPQSAGEAKTIRAKGQGR
jgi:transcriptional regulator with XRE-family HTH domain